ncbi:hypothetical protein C8R45DRAFT_934713 [Mycena sanguinolenta]|nr:hypothetical protein C8R45DRAFT_934713 [Mycena sanguinolenta]
MYAGAKDEQDVVQEMVETTTEMKADIDANGKRFRLELDVVSQPTSHRDLKGRVSPHRANLTQGPCTVSTAPSLCLLRDCVRVLSSPFSSTRNVVRGKNLFSLLKGGGASNPVILRALAEDFPVDNTRLSSTKIVAERLACCDLHGKGSIVLEKPTTKEGSTGTEPNRACVQIQPRRRAVACASCTAQRVRRLSWTPCASAACPECLRAAVDAAATLSTAARQQSRELGARVRTALHHYTLSASTPARADPPRSRGRPRTLHARRRRHAPNTLSRARTLPQTVRAWERTDPDDDPAQLDDALCGILSAL